MVWGLGCASEPDAGRHGCELEIKHSRCTGLFKDFPSTVPELNGRAHIKSDVKYGCLENRKQGPVDGKPRHSCDPARAESTGVASTHPMGRPRHTRVWGAANQSSGRSESKGSPRNLSERPAVEPTGSRHGASVKLV